MKVVVINPTGFELTVSGAEYPTAKICVGTQRLCVSDQGHFDWLKSQVERALKSPPHLVFELVEEPKPEEPPTNEEEGSQTDPVIVAEQGSQADLADKQKDDLADKPKGDLVKEPVKEPAEEPQAKPRPRATKDKTTTETPE